MSMSMPTSRNGMKPVSIPSGVELKQNAMELMIKGPKGQQVVTIHDFVNLEFESNSVLVKLNNKVARFITGPSKKLFRSILGTTRANIYNSIHGVSQGYVKKLVLQGVGYRAQMKGNVLGLSVGYSHPTEFDIPEGITIETPTPTEILIKGANKKLVGEVAANIRAIRPPEPYKGKGIRVANEVVKIKETKKK